MKGRRTIAATHHDLEMLTLGICRTADLAVVGGLANAHGRAEKSAAHHNIGIGVGAAGTGSHGGVALEVDVDL